MTEVELMTTTWVCSDGHSESVTEDLGDPADRQLVMRAEEDIFHGGCRRLLGDSDLSCWMRKRCGKKTKRSVETRTRYL
jgi:hypothetical protein